MRNYNRPNTPPRRRGTRLQEEQREREAAENNAGQEARQAQVELVPIEPQNQPRQQNNRHETFETFLGREIDDRAWWERIETGAQPPAVIDGDDMLSPVAVGEEGPTPAMSRRRFAQGKRTDEQENELKEEGMDVSVQDVHVQVTPWIKGAVKAHRYYAVSESETSGSSRAASSPLVQLQELRDLLPTPPKRARRDLADELNAVKADNPSPQEESENSDLLPFIEQQLKPSRYTIRVFDHGPPYSTETGFTETFTDSTPGYCEFPVNAPVKAHNIRTLEDALTVLKKMFEKDMKDLDQFEEEIELGQTVCVIETPDSMMIVGHALIFPVFQ